MIVKLSEPSSFVLFLFSIICSLGSSKKKYGLFHALLCSFNCFESYRYTCKCSASHFKWLKERAPLCNDLMETTLYTERQWVLSSCKASYILNTYFQHSLCSKENCITSTSVKTLVLYNQSKFRCFSLCHFLLISVLSKCKTTGENMKALILWEICWKNISALLGLDFLFVLFC